MNTINCPLILKYSNISQAYIANKNGKDQSGEYVNKAIAADLVETLIKLQNLYTKDGLRTGHVWKICEKAIEKALI